MLCSILTPIPVHLTLSPQCLRACVTPCNSFTVCRCLIVDMNCLEAHKTQVLSQLVCEGRGTEAASKIGELIHLVDRFEPLNHSLYYQLSLPLARLVSTVCRRCMCTHMYMY